MGINLVNCFKEYTKLRLENRSELTAADIEGSIYGALYNNDIGINIDINEALLKMDCDFELIHKTIHETANSHMIKSRTYGNSSQNNTSPNDDLLTIPEINSIYGISSQAITKACRERRLHYKEGNGKCKYLIQRNDIDLYIKGAKYKKKL